MMAKTPLSTGARKRSVTIRADIDKAAHDRVGDRGFSALVNVALEHELQRERIVEWLDEREALRGGKPLSKDAIAFAEAAWQKRKKPR